MMDFLFGQPTRILAVAVAFDPDHGFFLAYNQRWKGYAFPMRKVPVPDAALLEVAALDAVREASGLPLVGATAQPLGYRAVEGMSQRTGGKTLYRMHIHEIDTPVPLSLGLPVHGIACRRAFLRPEGFRVCDFLTWNTQAIISELLDNQEVALAVVCRRGEAGPEFLMLRSPNYRGYFPPASRIRTDVAPRFEAQQALHRDTGYRARIVPGEVLTASDKHHSPRYDCTRAFNFHLVQMALSDRVDLNDPSNDFELRLMQSGVLYRWVPAGDLANPAVNGLSPTIAGLAPHLRALAGKAGCA